MRETMTCPKCGAQMNHQANKLLEPTTREEAESTNVLGGLILAVYACPNCGWIASRRVDPEDG
jgi:hypothetical protein